MINVLIIGCGRIAGLYESKSSKSIYSHAKALKKNNNFEIKYCVDVNKNNLLKFGKKWNIKNKYLKVSKSLINKINLAVITTPTIIHKKSLQKIFKLKPKVILCEKPLSEDIFTIENLIKKKPKKTKLLISYQRRLNPIYNQLKNIIKMKKFGELKSITAVYNKGLKNNGSHLIDLLAFLVGKLKFEARGKPIFDYNIKDPSYPFLLSSGKISIAANIGDSRDYYIFYLKFIFEKKIIEFSENEKNIHYYKIRKSKSYKSFNDLVHEKKIPNRNNYVMPKIYKNLESFFKYKKKICITSEKEELNNFKLINKIIGKNENN